MSSEQNKILTISALNAYVKSLLESSSYLADIYITGEISNFTNHYKSGHLYMSLKDEGSLIKAVMFRGHASKLDFKPENGMKIICRGRVSLFERDGTYQLYITEMRQEGAGELQAKFEELKQRLKQEGLFDESLKRPLPKYPSKIAVITSPTGAAVQDILNILRRRYPIAKVVMCPVKVQGAGAAEELTAALRQVDEKGAADVIIIGRGGGSIEDLWAFNDERLARTIRNCKIPVISAVGHETDFTICDFAADLRAPTPSAAAEIAVPDAQELLAAIRGMKTAIKSSLLRTREQSRLKLTTLTNKQCLKQPLYYVLQKGQAVDMLFRRGSAAYEMALAGFGSKFLSFTAKLDSLSPLATLSRGYAAVYKDGQVRAKAAELSTGDEVNIKFSDGEKNAVIK